MNECPININGKIITVQDKLMKTNQEYHFIWNEIDHMAIKYPNGSVGILERYGFFSRIRRRLEYHIERRRRRRQNVIPSGWRIVREEDRERVKKYVALGLIDIELVEMPKVDESAVSELKLSNGGKIMLQCEGGVI